MSRWNTLAWTILGLVICGSSDAARCADRGKSLPEFSAVKEAVLRHFAAQPDYQPGDLIVRAEVEPVLKELKRMGWTVAGGEVLLGRVPDQSDYLAQQLRTADGRKFMRKIAKFPMAYDRLDRIARLPRGQQTVQELIHKVDGYKLIEYLTTTPGAKELGNMLSKIPAGADFNRPTGRIYTAEMLLEHLKRSHAAAVSGSGGSS